MGELENRLPVTKEKLARFEEFYRDAVYMDLFTQLDSNYNDEGALAKSIRSLGILRDLVFYMRSFAMRSFAKRRFDNNYKDDYKLKIAESNSMYTENAISFLSLDNDLSSEEKNEFNIIRSKVMLGNCNSLPNDKSIFGFQVYELKNIMDSMENTGGYLYLGVEDNSFCGDGISMSFPSDSDEHFDEIWGKTEPKEYDLFFYCLLAALDGVYSKNEKRFIAKIFRKFNNADETEKGRLNNFIEEICKHEQKLYELERSTESYAEVKEKLKQTIEDEKSSIKDLASTVMDLFN